MRIHAHRNIALHSASKGLIHVPAGTTKNLPNDVNEHPQMKMLKDSNYISVLKDKPDETKKLEVEIPHDEELLEELNDEEPKDEETNEEESEEEK